MTNRYGDFALILNQYSSHAAGAIFSLLHLNNNWTGYSPAHILPPEAQQRLVDFQPQVDSVHTKAVIELESTAPRIKSDFKPEDVDLIQGQKKKQWRRERRLKRFLAVVTGYLVMGWMVYLIMVTARTIPKIWDPYTILGVSRVCSEPNTA